MDTTSSGVLVTSVLGNHQYLDGGAMFGNAPRPMWEKWTTPDAVGRIKLACRCLLIECEGKRVLCETGIGSFFDPKLSERYGVFEKEHVLLASLQKLGLKESDIDYVILSHLHFDHAGGLLPSFEEMAKGRDELLFPKATYVVGEVALERCEHPHLRDRASFIPGMHEKLKQSGRLQVIKGEVFPGPLQKRISFFYSDGHTPGQMHTLVHGDQHMMCFAGDLVPGVAWMHLPITMGYDRYPEMVINEKQKLYQLLMAHDGFAFFTHDAEIAAALVTLDPKNRYVAGEQHRELRRFKL